jgi:ATP-binding cassette subfamily B multidrug efflux pump
MSRRPVLGRRRSMEEPKDRGKILRRLLTYLRPYTWQLIVIFLLMMVSSIATVAGSYFIKPIINQYILPGDFSGLLRMLMILATIYIFGALFSYIYERWMLHISQKVIYGIRRELFEHMQKLPLSYFDRNTQGDLMSRFSNDIGNLNDALSGAFLNIVSSGISFSGTLIAMLILSPVLFPLTLLSLIGMAYVGRFIGNKSKNAYRRQQKELGKLNGYIEEMIEGQKVIKVFNHEEKTVADFSVFNEELKNASVRAMTFGSSMMPAMMNLSTVSFAIVTLVGGLMTLAGRFDIGTLVAYLQYSRQVGGPIGRSTQQVNSIYSALAGAERVFGVLDENPEIDEGTIHQVNVREENGQMVECVEHCQQWAWKRKESDGSYSLQPVLGDIRFHHVDFSYVEGTPVLKDISLFAKPGEKIAFVGSTGAGKTTLTNLITRFYESDSGTITYDGIDIRDISKEDLRRSFGVVLQDVRLFSGTIRENIRYGRLDATDEEVEEAAKLANADTFISYLPDGYDTFIEGDGASLSQGERQLLSIARAAVLDPPVLILDEATSSVDTLTERRIQAGMDNLMKGRTVLVIAHRLSTVQDSDAILVMEDGEIIERGMQEDLLALQGRYYELYTGKAKLA